MSNLVVFHDNGGHPLDFLLKKGFRHCFCVVASGNYWIQVDATIGLPELNVIAGTDYDLEQYYIDEGYTVVKAKKDKPSPYPYLHNNCVGMIKSVLGLRTFAVTPYQLFKYLGGHE